MGHMRVAKARVIAGGDSHNGAVPEVCAGFLQVPRDAFVTRAELGALHPPVHAAAVGAGALDADDGDGSGPEVDVPFGGPPAPAQGAAHSPRVLRSDRCGAGRARANPPSPRAGGRASFGDFSTARLHPVPPSGRPAGSNRVPRPSVYTLLDLCRQA